MFRQVNVVASAVLCIILDSASLLAMAGDIQDAILHKNMSFDPNKFIPIDGSESIRTHSDNQFVKAYNNFRTSKYPQIFIPVAIVCVFIGSLGNIGFFALFGNKLRRAYYTRDSLYFRFLATLDILVCLVVLPYAMFFEEMRVTNNYLCKGMEYVRHFLTYMAHLGLLSYSFELPLRQGYTASKNHVRRASYGIVILSAVCSIPVIFLFKVDPAALNNKMEPVLYVKVSSDEDVDFEPAFASLEPKYCHMTFNFDTASKYYEMIEYAKKMYYGINTLLYSAGLLLFVYKVILFIDARPLLGQDSIFIQTVIDVRENSFCGPSTNEFYSKMDRRKVSTTSPMYLIRKEEDDMLEEIEAMEAKAHGQNGKKSRSANGKDQTGTNNDVRNIDSKEDSASSTRSNNNNVDSLDDHIGRDRKVSFGDAMVDSIMFNPDESVQRMQKSESRLPYTRPILKSTDKPTLRISSYKKSMMFLIFLDLLIITLTVIIDLAIKNSSTVLNFIHFKSVFSFYIISLTNKELRAATWGRYFECCNKLPSNSKRPTTSSTGPEFFGSNVRPELMRAWGRSSYEGTASDVTDTSNVSGVSDIPAPVLLQDRAPGSTRTSVMIK